MRGFRACLVLLGCLVAASRLLAQPADAPINRATILAADEFRRGVQAFHRYAYNESILALEKALSFQSQAALYMDWLGRAYYRSGLEDTALGRWREAYAHYPKTSGEALVIGGRIETIRNRRALSPDLDDQARYVEAASFPGRNADSLVFSQPTGLLPNPDGSVWVVAYGSNELVRLDANGLVKTRLRGPLTGFDRPYDIVRAPDGRFFVSEFIGNRISVLGPNGDWRSYIGAKGRGEGQFVGPQNLAWSDDGYLYVVDFGNKRVQKFDGQGQFVLSFGQPRLGFNGLLTPTGITSDADYVYVADASAGRIARFDHSGNFWGWLGEGGLTYPESLRLDDDGRLLVADTSRIVLIDPASGFLKELSNLGSAGVRLVSADIDVNGNIVAANFAGSELTVLARIDDLASGLFVQLDRISCPNYPEVLVELSVQDRRRRPIVGLDNRNFVLMENGSAVLDQKFLGSADASSQTAIALLVERSERTAGYQTAIGTAASDLAKLTQITTIVSAGEQPVLEDSASAGRSRVSHSADWRFDLGLRLAVGELLPGLKKRSIVFITSGRLGDRAFERYGPSDLAAYLANNSVVFDIVLVGDGRIDAELRYICEQTGGMMVGVYDPRGVAPLIDSLSQRSIGSYTLSYRSISETDFGRAYLALSAEAYYLDRSGRDLAGYFSDLQ